jgi:hypothetical protein
VTERFTLIDGERVVELPARITGDRVRLDAAALRAAEEVGRHQPLPSAGDQQARAEFGPGRWLLDAGALGGRRQTWVAAGQPYDRPLPDTAGRSGRDS